MNEAEQLDLIDAHQRKINGYRPFGPELWPQIRAYYRVGLTYSSNAIEGFSYTESETKVLLEDGLTVGGKPLKDALAVTGHAEAYDYASSLLSRRTLSNDDILHMHEFLAQSLDSGSPGRFRETRVFVSGSQHAFPGPEVVPGQMREFGEWMRERRGKLHPVEFAVTLHKKLVLIHPFEDGNGRTARLAMNTVLIQDGYLPIVVPPVLRSEYIAALEKAHTDDSEFKRFMFNLEIEEQKSFLRMVRGK